MAKIGIVGYYGWGNYGDELFAEAFRQFLAPHTVVVLPQITTPPYYTEPIERRLENVDVVVVGGGDLCIPWHVSDLYWNPAYLKKPVIIYGIGVPLWGGVVPHVVDVLRKFVNHPSVRSVITRDPHSMDWIAESLGVEQKLSWYPDVVCALAFRKKRARSLGQVFTLVTRAQTEELSQKEGSICRWAANHGYHVRQLILASGPTAADDLVEASGMLYAPREIVIRGTTHGLTDELLKSSLVASMKFHGCVVAMMAGIPTVSLSRAEKFTSFYEMLGREDLITTVLDHDKFEALDRAHRTRRIRHVAALRKKAREGLLRLRDEIETVAGRSR